MNILALLSLLAGLASVGVQGAKSKKTREHQDKVYRTQKENQEQADKESRRRAMERAIGSDLSFYSKPQKMVEPLDTRGLDIAGGVTSMIGQAAAGADSLGMGDKFSAYSRARQQKRQYQDLLKPERFKTNIGDYSNLPNYG